MLISCLLTIYRWFKKITPESRSLELFMTRDTVMIVGVSAGLILGLLLGSQYLGIYISLVVFLIVYLRFVGHHEWRLTISLAILIPVFIFSLFEWALKIPLPKAITEEAFYPVYDLMYAQNSKEAIGSFKNPIVSIPIFASLAVIVYWVTVWFKRGGAK